MPTPVKAALWLIAVLVAIAIAGGVVLYRLWK
jgi:hypothetical protein